jgi:Concanavalin A-like lectin/glucanases superfamily/Immunoglobulin domain
MKIKTLVGLVSVIVTAAMAPIMPVQAQPVSAFYQAVTNLNPVAYWPLQETAQPPAADVEPNLGSLGAAGDAYYSSTNVYQNQSGAQADYNDPYVYCSGSSGGFLAVPTTDKRVSLTNGGPFTVELWISPANYNGYRAIIAQAGANPGGLNGSGNKAGWVMSQNYIASSDSQNFRGFSFHVYNGNGNGGAEADFTGLYSLNTWYYLVGVFDGTNAYLYVNGVNVGTASPIGGSFVPDMWDPLTIGCGRGLNANLYAGGIDEVAIYTNALTASQVQTHFYAAGGSYSTTVMGDHPYMYWRMDATNYTVPDVSAYPVAANYGNVVNTSGLYLSGTTPGVAGPALAGMGSPSYACAFNGIGTDNTGTTTVFTNGVAVGDPLLDSGIIITNLDDSLNQATNSLTVLCWFKGNPADNRFQCLVGHSDHGWRLALGNGGNAGHLQFNPGAGSDVVSSGVYNDGNWHFAACVSSVDPSTGMDTNYLYVDGVLDAMAVTNAVATSSSTNILIGGAPDYVDDGNGGSYRNRYFSGSLAQVAFFNNALTADQIINLYTNATGGVPPSAPIITGQPYPYPSVRNVVAGPGVYIYEGVNASGGTPDLGYQWYYNSSSNYAGATALVDDGVHYVDATTFNMTLTNLTSSDNGYYFCVVNNNYGSVTSAIVNVQVITAPVITAQDPSGAFSLFPNQQLALSVTALGETNNLSYQWLTNGLADTTAGGGSTYAITAGVGAAISGATYQCIVTNDFGAVTSAVATLTVEPLPASIADSSYATNILALNPTAYWPLHETTPAAPGAVETNLGTLGNLANGYYADFYTSTHSSDITRDVSGALAGDDDTAAYFNAGNTSYPTSGPRYVLVPLTASAANLQPPFSVELWFNPDNTHFSDLMDAGFRLVWSGHFSFYNSLNTPNYSAGQWYHVVVTVDKDSNVTIYVNGSAVAGPEYISSGFLTANQPITIGDGLWQGNGPVRPAAGAIDEVAIYSTNLDSSQIQAHYYAALYPGSYGAYDTNVLADDPIIYLRMDAPTYTAPDQNTWPVANNYGTAPMNGVYTPGSVPGEVDGPNNGAGLISSTLSGTKALAGNGMSAYVDAGYSPALDPTSYTPLSVSVWFKGNPADSARFQTILGGGNSSWRANMDNAGKLRFQVGSNPSLTSTTSYNDGIWHQLVGVWDGTTEYLYVDGMLDNVDTNATNAVVSSSADVLLGAAPDYLTSGSSVGRNFSGAICEAAFWNGTALTPGQVTTLYQASGMAPIISMQPISATVDGRTAFTNMVAAFGPGPLMYQWYRDGQPLPIGGQTNLTFGGTNAGLVINPVKASDASSDYYAVISNLYGSTTSSVVSLSVNSEPVFTFEPMDVTLTNNIQLFAGAAPTFTVVASGAQPISYQWFTNGVAATPNDPALTSYTLPPVQLAGGVTSFYCQASNFVGTTESTPISISVQAAPTAPYPVAVMMDNPVGYWRLNEPDDQLSDGNAGVLADDYWGGDNGIYTNTILGQTGYGNASGTDPSTTSAEFGIDSFADGNAYGINGVDFAAPTNTSMNFSIEAWVNGYQQTKDAGIVSKGYGGGGEQFDLDTGSRGAGSGTYSFRFFVRDANGATHGANSAVTPSPGTWHHLVGVCDEVNGNVTLYVDGAVAGQGTIPPGSGILASDRAMLIGSRPSGAATANDDQFVGFVNDVAVYDYALSASQVGAEYAAAGVPPNFTQAPPTNVTVDGYGLLTLPAGAVGTPDLGYYWTDLNAGTNVAAGATNGPLLDATLTVSNVPLTWNNNTLQLTVTNAYGSTNYFVTLTVYTNAPEFTVDLPPNVIVPVGKSYTYSVSVVGPQPYGYQWYHGPTAINGETNSTYSLVAGSPGSTTYSVVVSNRIGASLSTISTFTSVAQPSGYSYVTNVLGLNPAGYWPLQETSAPATTTMETNFGTLGALGDAYYAGTNAATPGVLGGNVSFGQTPGALTSSGDNDPAVGFVGGNNLNETNSYLFVPIKTPVLALNGPVTYECWVNSSSGGFADLMGNGGIDGDGSGNWSGLRLSWNRGTSIQAYWYPGNGSTLASADSGANTITMGQWYHVALTFDGANVTFYINGVQKNTAAATIATNYWTPLSIGCGRWDGSHETRSYSGQIDEVAIYTNALAPARIAAHYDAGTTSSGSNYVSAVLADKPLLFYRMDCDYATPNPVDYPVAINFGSAPVNGNYPSGIVPGGVSGPANPVLGTNSPVLAAPINGVFSCVDAGLDPAFDPSGTQPFSAMVWFKGYPCDNRVQTIMSHGVTNWAMNLDGTTGRIVWNLYNGGQVTSTTTLNDGSWHFLAGVYDGVTSYLYVDGQLNNSATVANTNGLAAEPNAHLFLGGNSDYPYPQAGGVGTRYLAGALAQAAFFTNALTASQLQLIYNGSVTPTIGLGRSGNSLVISYTGALLSSTNVAGPYNPVAGAPFAASPAVYAASPTDGQMFYRASSQ